MSFDEEWAELRSAAAEKQTAMRLNQLDPGGGGGPGPQGDLVVTQKDLAAVGDAAFKLRQRLGTDGDHAKASTYEAAGSLKKDFALGAALSTVADKWHDQEGTLLDACAHISQDVFRLRENQLRALSEEWAKANPGHSNDPYTLENEIDLAAVNGNKRAKGLAGTP
ncbi:hypothetical protein AB0F11_22935 [Streptomyces sp. NPDC032472]|uniref:hypothetical protein n=1 Tax=Streptomyces sp. NPDC032472 TaxID=3155018 RepID=UPI0033EE2C48